MPDSDAQSLRKQVDLLREELASLGARYDTLAEAHARASRHYKANFKRWRDFKRCLFPGAESDDQLASFLKSDEFRACAKSYSLRVQGQSEVSDLKTDEQSVKPECVAEAVPPEYQRRNSYHGEPSQKLPSPSPTLYQDPFLVPLSTNSDDDSSLRNNEVPPKLGPSRPLPSTEPRRRKGRYAHVPSGIDTINSRFSIRKDKNQGMDFQYDAVVRNQEERKHMLGSDCECCREYYEAVGPLPASRQPLWRTPTKRKSPYTLRVCNKENTEAEEHKQMISRHRHHWHRPKTPPGYWDIGFPDTQEVSDINRRAAEMHKRKLLEVEADAKSSNSRYVERAPRTP